MSKTIYAEFGNIDEAENAARKIREHCMGIQAVRIRYQEIGELAPDLPVSSFALFDSGDSSVNGGHGMSASFSPVVYFDSDFSGVPNREERDGPQGRTDCSMEIISEDPYAENVARVLRSARGRKVTIIG